MPIGAASEALKLISDFQMSQEKKISQLLSGKPAIEPVGPSSLLSRLQNFLPQMEEANRNLEASPSENQNDFIIESVAESSSSDDDDDDDNEDKDLSDEEKMNEEKEAVAENNHIEIDVDVFREMNSKVDNRDVSVQEVEKLPEAFRMEDVGGEKEKVLIEEM